MQNACSKNENTAPPPQIYNAQTSADCRMLAAKMKTQHCNCIYTTHRWMQNAECMQQK
jgi:hypothetical protein